MAVEMAYEETPMSCSTRLSRTVLNTLRAKAKLGSRAWDFCSYLHDQTFGNAGWHRKKHRSELWCDFDLATWAAELNCNQSNVRRIRDDLVACQIIQFIPTGKPGDGTGRIGWNDRFDEWQPYDQRRTRPRKDATPEQAPLVISTRAHLTLVPRQPPPSERGDASKQLNTVGKDTPKQLSQAVQTISKITKGACSERAADAASLAGEQFSTEERETEESTLRAAEGAAVVVEEAEQTDPKAGAHSESEPSDITIPIEQYSQEAPAAPSYSHEQPDTVEEPAWPPRCDPRAQALWEQVKLRIQQRPSVSHWQFSSWIAASVGVAWEGDVLTVRTRLTGEAQQLELRYRNLIDYEAQSLAGAPVRVDICAPGWPPPDVPDEPEPGAAPEEAPAAPAPPAEPEPLTGEALRRALFAAACELFIGPAPAADDVTARQKYALAVQSRRGEFNAAISRRGETRLLQHLIQPWELPWLLAAWKRLFPDLRATPNALSGKWLPLLIGTAEGMGYRFARDRLLTAGAPG